MYTDITILWVNLGTFLGGLLYMPSDTLASYRCTTTANTSTWAGQQLLGDAWAYGWTLTLVLTAAYRLANNRDKTAHRLGDKCCIDKVAHRLGFTIVPLEVYQHTGWTLLLYHQGYTGTRAGLCSCTTKGTLAHRMGSAPVPPRVHQHTG